MHRQRNQQIFVFLSLFFLVAEILLLFFKTKAYTDHPFWLSSLILLIFFTIATLYFHFLEIQEEKKSALKREKILSERIANLSEVLKETQRSYREKMHYLESECEKIEHFKTLSDALRISLDDALEEMRKERLENFFSLEKKKNENTSELGEDFAQEKSAILENASKNLFALEEEHILLQKQLSTLNEDMGIKYLIEQLQEIEQEKQILEKEIFHLESLVDKLSIKKNSTKKPKKKEEIMQLQFEE